MTTLTAVEQVKILVGLKYLEIPLIEDVDIEYFLELSKGNVVNAAKRTANAVLFTLSQYLHEKSGLELEIWGHTWFENYKAALEMFLKDQHYNVALNLSKGGVYAGGISVEDILTNINDEDIYNPATPRGVPTDDLIDGQGGVELSPFDDDSFKYTNLRL